MTEDFVTSETLEKGHYKTVPALTPNGTDARFWLGPYSFMQSTLCRRVPAQHCHVLTRLGSKLSGSPAVQEAAISSLSTTSPAACIHRVNKCTAEEAVVAF
jgi:hypothetical protein